MADKKKIFIVDDERDFLLLVKGNLEDTGEFEVITSDKAEEVENIALQERPDLILLDNVMPQRKGSEVVKALKKIPETTDIPVIMISGRGEMVYVKNKDQYRWMPNTRVVANRGNIAEGKNPQQLADAYGVKDYISKPFSTELLLEVIHEILSQDKTEEQPPAPYLGIE